ncbi:retrovirus-related pol polyprotein from transposon TNT 1-94 [Tanacetum coccineum]
MFHLKKTHRIKPILYDGIVMSDKHVVMPVIDDEETLILEEEDLLNEIMEVKTVFDQMDAAVQQSSVDKQSQLEDEDSTICKLKDTIKSLREKSKDENVKYDYCEIETKNVELENIVAKLLSENKHLCNEINHVKQELLVYVRDTCPNAINLSAKKVKSSKTSDSNTHVFSSTILKCSTSKSGSKPTSNKRNDRISQTPSRNMKNKVEAQHRKVNNKNRVVEPICDDNVKYSKINANSDLNCATCKKSLFDDVHDKCLLDFVKNVNSRAKSAKKHKKQNIWKPTGHVFTEVRFKWKPRGRTFTIVGNSSPLTRFTSANVVPPKKTTSHSVETQKPKLKVYSRKPKIIKNVGSSKKAKIVESKNANHSEPNHTWGSNDTYIPSSSSLVMTGCPDCSLVSGLWMFETHDRESLSAHELSSKTKSWLWHRRLSHLNFACALGKSKKSSHQPKAEDTNQEKLYLLHMDLCGPMCVASINGKRYILVIVDDYSRFTWVKFLRTKDKASEAIIRCIKNIQVRLNATVRNVRTDNGTEFLNQTLREFYENVGISHQTSVAHTPQQNGVVER